MYIARILYPVKTLGPGNRIGIWVAGCCHHCKGCSNPELWEKQEKYWTELEQVVYMVNSIVAKNPVDGFTITGGDPFEQPEALQVLLPELKPISEDILVYTGYKYEEIKDRYAEILGNISVIIDGPYIDELNQGEALRGSINQNIIILKSNYSEIYNSYIEENQGLIQNFYTPTGVISVGIHRPDYEQELDMKLTEKGLER